MSELSLFIAIATALILVTGFWDVPLQRSVVTEPLITMAVGIVVGPHIMSWFRPSEWGTNPLEVLNHFAKYTLAMALMAAALRLPERYALEAARPQILLITLGMALMSLFSAGVFFAVLGGSFLMCLLLGAIVAPTDPVLATTIVSGRVARERVSDRLRFLLSGESGANDGIALPYVMLPLLLIQWPDRAWSEWLLRVALYENLLGVLLGAGIGLGVRSLVKRAMKAGLMDSKALLSITVALGFLVLTGLELLRCNGIAGVFAAGLAFNYHMSRDPEAQEERVQEMIERIFVGPIFLLFGILIPWEAIVELGWKAWAIALGALLLRRLPALLLLKPTLAPLQHWRDAVFVGWFGPIGVAALYYATHLRDKIDEPLVWTVTSITVCASVLIHGVTASPVSVAYARREGRKT